MAASSARRSASVLCAPSSCVAQLVAFELALGQQPALVGEPRFQFLRAAAEDFGFGRLRDQLALELADPVAEILDLAALLVELGRGVAGVVALAVEPVARCP